MLEIKSKVDTEKVLHVVVKGNDFTKPRTDIISEHQFIQCSFLLLEKGKTFKPHKHIWKQRNEKVVAQESWVVLSGSVKCTFYDLDNSILCEHILYAGDASFTLEGGHNYTILEDNTRVYEYKTGPYGGQSMDKEFI